MLELGDLLVYVLAKEACLDGHGSMRLESSEKTIRSLIAHDRRLWDLLDFTKQVEQGEMYSLTKQKAENTPSVDKRMLLHLIGRIERTGTSSAVISQSNGDVTIDITVKIIRNTRMECNAETFETVHAFVDKSKQPRLRSVVSEELFRMIRAYCDREEDQIKLVEEFLLLPPTAQATLKRVLCDGKATKSTLFFLTFLASHSANGFDFSSKVETAVHEFNSYYAAELKCEPVCLGDVQCILNLDTVAFHDILSPCQGLQGWVGSYFKCFLVLHGVVSGLSPWMYSGKSIAQVLADHVPSHYIRMISEYLPNLCDHDSYQAIMDEILANSKAQPYRLGNMEDMLFEALTVFQFEPSFVNKAIDILFKDSIAYYQVTAIKRLVNGPNGYVANKYIFEQFTRRFYEGETAFHFVAAAILNARAVEKGIDPLQDAVESSILPMGGDDLLLGIARVSLIAWTQIDKRNRLDNKTVISPCFVKILLNNVKNFDKRYYSISASALHDLILARYLSQDLLSEPAIYQTALQTLQDEGGKLWAERLLALIPWDTTRVAPSAAVELCVEYVDRMETAFLKKDEALEPEIMFGALENLGYWKNRTLDKATAYQKLVQFYRFGADDTQLRRMSLLKARIEKENLL